MFAPRVPLFGWVFGYGSGRGTMCELPGEEEGGQEALQMQVRVSRFGNGRCAAIFQISGYSWLMLWADSKSFNRCEFPGDEMKGHAIPLVDTALCGRCTARNS